MAVLFWIALFIFFSIRNKKNKKKSILNILMIRLKEILDPNHLLDVCFGTWIDLKAFFSSFFKNFQELFQV